MEDSVVEKKVPKFIKLLSLMLIILNIWLYKRKIATLTSNLKIKFSIQIKTRANDKLLEIHR